MTKRTPGANLTVNDTTVIVDLLCHNLMERHTYFVKGGRHLFLQKMSFLADITSSFILTTSLKSLFSKVCGASSDTYSYLASYFTRCVEPCPPIREASLITLKTKTIMAPIRIQLQNVDRRSERENPLPLKFLQRFMPHTCASLSQAY